MLEPAVSICARCLSSCLHCAKIEGRTVGRDSCKLSANETWDLASTINRKCGAAARSRLSMALALYSVFFNVQSEGFLEQKVADKKIRNYKLNPRISLSSGQWFYVKAIDFPCRGHWGWTAQGIFGQEIHRGFRLNRSSSCWWAHKSCSGC